jgi:hypothetical protein
VGLGAQLGLYAGIGGAVGGWELGEGCRDERLRCVGRRGGEEEQAAVVREELQVLPSAQAAQRSAHLWWRAGDRLVAPGEGAALSAGEDGGAGPAGWSSRRQRWRGEALLRHRHRDGGEDLARLPRTPSVVRVAADGLAPRGTAGLCVSEMGGSRRCRVAGVGPTTYWAVTATPAAMARRERWALASSGAAVHCCVLWGKVANGGMDGERMGSADGVLASS